MLKLIFSPYYDGNCYAGNPAENKCVIGTKHVGSRGLLDELELRSGLSRGETSPMQRAIAYCNAIREVLANNPNPKPFYKQSFENDPLGVAQQLLRWRDALRMAGWNKDTTLPDSLSADGKKRLEDLQKIEVHFNIIGIGERWQILLAEAKKRNILPADVSIEVDMKMEYLPPIIRNVLEEIKNNGGNISESQNVASVDKKSFSDFADKFILYQFPEQNDAYQWAVTQTEITPDVYINEDNFTFNQVLKSVGKPLVEASIQGSIPEMSQLLKLGIALFRQPVNLTHLTNYLNIFRHPIQWQTRSDLRYKIQKYGGFKSVTDKNGKLIPFSDPTINDTVSDQNLWGMWEKQHTANGDVLTKDVTNFCDALLDWLKKAKQVAAIEFGENPDFGVQLCSQLAVLEKQTNSLKAYISSKNDISNDELDKLVASICQGDSIQTDYGRLGSYDMLKDIKGQAASGKTVMWMDCVRKPRPRYEYAFMNPADIKRLQEIGLLIPDASLEMQASEFAEKLAVSRAERIIALMPQRKDGERTEENLLITELRAIKSSIPINRGNKVKLPATVTENFTPKGIAPQEVEYKIRNKRLLKNIDKQAPKAAAGTGFTHTAGYQLKHESFSSLNGLINYPFDYLLNDIFNLKEDDSSNLSQTEGNVAHDVISKLVEKSILNKIIDTNKFIALCNNKSDVKKLIDKVIQEKGAELLLPENQKEKKSFIRTLFKKNIPTLTKIIDENNLEFAGSEMTFIKPITINDTKGTNTFFNLESTIDFILKKTGNFSQIEYNVAHDVLSELVEESTKNIIDTNKFIALCNKKSDVKKLIDKAIQDKGAELLLPENQMEMNFFIRTLSQQTIPTLAKIIEENNLEVEGSEMTYIKPITINGTKGTKTIFNLKSIIDFILKKTDENQQTKYYIFDFKWTTKPQKRKEELENCKELQLALYKWILEKEHGAGCVEMYGYYLLKQTKLLTTYTNFSPNAVQQKQSYNLFDQAVESYRERIKNLKDGFIEEGEDMPGPKFENTKFFTKYLNESVMAKALSNSFFLDNNLSITYTKNTNTAKMKSGKKAVSYNYAVLKNRIK